jgi:hypothetical protein
MSNEPVAWCHVHEDGVIDGLQVWSDEYSRTPLYTHPVLRERLGEKK